MGELSLCTAKAFTRTLWTQRFEKGCLALAACYERECAVGTIFSFDFTWDHLLWNPAQRKQMNCLFMVVLEFCSCTSAQG